ncbi:MAG TPA: hypothetical protein VKB86_03455 [Pyrinomonadaceae bacterium]|nr:hypothetical protein [Pyrinomonadaceae bacterium]
MPNLQLKIQITEEEAAQIKSWQVQGLVESDDEILDSLILIRNKKKENPAQAKSNFRTAINTKQRVVIYLGIVVIALMLLVPPWKFYREGRGAGGAAGYGFIFDSGTRVRIDLESFSIGYARQDSVYLDTATLMIQCLFVAVITGGLVFLFQTRK